MMSIDTGARKMGIFKFHQLGFFGILFLVGCFSSPPPKSLVGTRPFSFDPEQVREFTLVKSDPTTGDNWSADFKKNPASSQSSWQITSPPLDLSLADREADATFLNHLIDVLKTIRVKAEAPNGPLGSFGLEPPRFAIRWKTPSQSFEFRLGELLPDSSGIYFTLDGKKVWVAEGAAFKMLALIDSFHLLRKRTWSSWTSDDVDEVEIHQRGRPILYAQREGSRWTDRAHREVKKDINRLLEKLTARQAPSLIDDPLRVSQIRWHLEAIPAMQVKLIDRSGNAESLQIITDAKSVYGLAPARPGVVFQESQDFLKELQGLIF